ncbi:MAG: pilus assembly protein PilM [Candidatus Omnitrophota bacterium]
MTGLKKKDIYIGIDIGSSFIKAVEIEASSAGVPPVLRKVRISPRSEGIRKAVAGMSFKSANTVAVVDCSGICLRYFTVPIMPDRELDEAVKWEAKSKISFPLGEAVMDYAAQEKVQEAGVLKLRIQLVAAPASLINNALKELRECGIEPVSIIEPPLAAEHLLRSAISKKSETAAIVDIGSDFTGISIIKNGLLKFYRKINSGGAAITKAMTAPLTFETGRVELSGQQAERIKMEYGILRGSETNLIENSIPPMLLVSLLRPSVEQLFKEMERSFEYYSEASFGDKVKSAILFGGGARLKGLREFLEENLELPVSIGDSLKGVDVMKDSAKDAAEFSHRLCNALGAALSKGKGINLLPREIKEKTKRFFLRAAAKSLIAAILAAEILIFIGMKIQVLSYDRKIAAANLEFKAMFPQLEIASNYERLYKKISAMETFIESLLGKTPSWEEVFKELSNKIPTEVVFTEMRMSNNELFIKGEISGTVGERDDSLSNLITLLEGGLFSRVSLVRAAMGDDKTSKSEFEIKCAF